MNKLSKSFTLFTVFFLCAAICLAETEIKEFTAQKGKLKKNKGKLPWLLEVEKGHAVALTKLDKPITRKTTFKLKLQTATKRGICNGFLLLKSSDNHKIDAGVQIGSKSFLVFGDLIKGIKVNDAKMSRHQIFDLIVTVDLQAKTLTMTVNGQDAGKTQLRNSFKNITEIGFHAINTTTKFSSIIISSK